jgi:hypothetical protein
MREGKALAMNIWKASALFSTLKAAMEGRL